MNPRDLALVMLVVIVWGANFTVIKIGLADIPPMVLAAMRYIVVALPAVFFVPRPNVPARPVIAYGLTVGVGQFGALFYAMYVGMPASLASVVMQAQAIFTTLFAYLFLGERSTLLRLAGVGIAASGLALIGWSVVRSADATAPVAAMMFTLLASASWGLSNVVIRRLVGAAADRGETVDMLRLVVWSALVPPVPLLTLSYLLHGAEGITDAFTGWTWSSALAVAFIGYLATLFGFGAWSHLLSRYPANAVAPFSLLVPVTGLLTAGLVLGEQLTPLQWAGSITVGLGLLVFTRGRSLPPRPKAPPRPEEALPDPRDVSDSVENV